MKIEPKKKKVTMSTHVTEDIEAMIEYLAACNGVSKSSVIEQILEHHKEMILGGEEDKNACS